MIDIDRIRAVFFDFEDTLAIYPTRKEIDDEKEKNLFLNDVAACSFIEDDHTIPSLYSYIQRSSTMSVFLDILMGLPQNTRPKLVLFGVVPNIAVAECQRRWLRNSYSVEMEMFCTSSEDGKIPTALSVARALGIRPEECLVVDDSFTVLKNAEHVWMKSASPLEVTEFALSYVSDHPSPGDFIGHINRIDKKSE